MLFSENGRNFPDAVIKCITAFALVTHASGLVLLDGNSFQRGNL